MTREAMSAMRDSHPGFHHIRLGFREGEYEVRVVEEPTYQAAEEKLYEYLPDNDVVGMIREKLFGQ